MTVIFMYDNWYSVGKIIVHDIDIACNIVE